MKYYYTLNMSEYGFMPFLAIFKKYHGGGSLVITHFTHVWNRTQAITVTSERFIH